MVSMLLKSIDILRIQYEWKYTIYLYTYHNMILYIKSMFCFAEISAPVNRRMHEMILGYKTNEAEKKKDGKFSYIMI